MKRVCLLGTAISAMGCQPMTHDDPADLTPVARAMEAAAYGGGVFTARDIPGLGGPPMPDVFEAPQTVRMWLRSEGGSASCDGPVIEVELEEYIRNVVPHEWYASWHEESLMAGATAARSYAAWWVRAGGKYDCADVCDTSFTQNYGDTTHERTDTAIRATAHTFIMDGDAVVFAEYSAENGDPTEYGVDEPLCAGEELYGHGRGMCQWGTQRWANDGKDHEWMVDHYYLGATLLGPLEAERLDTVYRVALEAGETRTVELSWENLGSMRWRAGEMHLDTTGPEGRASDFSATWETESRAMTLESDVRPGDIGLFELTLVAPEVADTTEFSEQFGLYSSELDDWVAGSGVFELSIQVYPLGSEPTVDTGGAGQEDTAERSPEALPYRDDKAQEGGCACAHGATPPTWGFWVGLLALLRRRASR